MNVLVWVAYRGWACLHGSAQPGAPHPTLSRQMQHSPSGLWVQQGESARHNSPNEHLVNHLWTEQQRVDARAAHQQHARHLAWQCHARCLAREKGILVN